MESQHDHYITADFSDWFEVKGDIDEFIFYTDEPQISEK